MRLRFAAIALLALALPSCATYTAVEKIAGYKVSQKDVAVAVQAFDGVKATATNTLKLPICTATQKQLIDGCITVATGRTIITDVRVGTAARNSLWVASKGSTEGVGAYDAYNAVIAATTALKTDLTK